LQEKEVLFTNIPLTRGRGNQLIGDMGWDVSKFLKLQLSSKQNFVSKRFERKYFVLAEFQNLCFRARQDFDDIAID
jgi:hypothetical protein